MVLRAAVFPDRPDCILFLVTEGEPLSLPVLETPFERIAVAKALGLAGIKSNVFETVPGRWTSAMTKAKRDESSTAGQEQKQETAFRAALLRGSPNLHVQKHAEALQRKHETDERIRALKVEIGNAKSAAATRGVYMPPQQYRRKEAKLEELKQESQALQTLLGELRQKERDENRKLHEGNEEKQKKLLWQACSEVLSPEQLNAVKERQQQLREENEEEAQGEP